MSHRTHINTHHVHLAWAGSVSEANVHNQAHQPTECNDVSKSCHLTHCRARSPSFTALALTWYITTVGSMGVQGHNDLGVFWVEHALLLWASELWTGPEIAGQCECTRSLQVPNAPPQQTLQCTAHGLLSELPNATPPRPPVGESQTL